MTNDLVTTPTVGAELAAAAIEHGDDHVIKLTESALRQHDRTGDVALLVAGERFRTRTASPQPLPASRSIVRPDNKPVGSSLIVNVDDFELVTAFYRNVLGLQVEKSWTAPAGSGMIFEISPGTTVEFAGPPYAERRDRTPAIGVELMIEVDDAPAWRDRLRVAGVPIERDLIENPWGDRSFGVDDPSGRRVWIFERIGVRRPGSV